MYNYIGVQHTHMCNSNLVQQKVEFRMQSRIVTTMVVPGRYALLKFCRESAFLVGNASALGARVQRSHNSLLFSRVHQTSNRLLSSSNRRGKYGGVPEDGGWYRSNGGRNKSDFRFLPPWMLVLPATLVVGGGGYYFSHREAAPFTGNYLVVYWGWL